MTDIQTLNTLEMAARLLEEAGNLISCLPPDELEKIPTYRWPLADELGGAVGICHDTIRVIAEERKQLSNNVMRQGFFRAGDLRMTIECCAGEQVLASQRLIPGDVRRCAVPETVVAQTAKAMVAELDAAIRARKTA